MRRLIQLLLCLLFASSAYGQIENCAAYRRIIDNIAASTATAEVVASETSKLVDIGQAPRCFALAAAGANDVNRQAFQVFVRRFESLRSDKQAGAGSASGVSTSVVAQ